MTSWAQNDGLFLAELREGYAWQMLPAVFFTLQGFRVNMPTLEERQSLADIAKWIDSVDLEIEGHILEVKSRNEVFTAPSTFPYQTIIVDTVSGYEGKAHKPLAYVFVSRPTGAMICLRGDTPHAWAIERKHDHVRDIDDNFYVAPIAGLRSLSALVTALQGFREKSTNAGA